VFSAQAMVILFEQYCCKFSGQVHDFVVQETEGAETWCGHSVQLKPGKKRLWEGVFKIWFYFSLSCSDLIGDKLD